MSAVLVTGPTVTQNSPFLLWRWRNHHQYSFCLPEEGWPGWVGLGGWLHTKMVYPFWRRLPNTRPSTNRPQRWLTSLMRPTTLPTKPNRQVAAPLLGKVWDPWSLLLNIISAHQHKQAENVIAKVMCFVLLTIAIMCYYWCYYYFLYKF